MEGEAGLGSVAGGEGAGEQSLFGKVEKLLPSEVEALATIFFGGDITALTDDLRFASVAKFPNFGEQVVTSEHAQQN